MSLKNKMMKNAFIYMVIFSFGGCVSQKEIELKQEELLLAKAENKRIKDEVKGLQVLQKKMADTLEFERKIFLQNIEIQKSNVHYVKFKADSLLIAKCTFATEVEKEVMHYLNFVRSRPREFCEKFVIPNWDKSSWYENTLVETLMGIKPTRTMLPKKKLYLSAECHARISGKAGKVGHTRIKDPKTKKLCEEYFMGECISYGSGTGLGIVLQLMIDNGVENLGHRKIILNGGYSSMGVSVQPHARYGVNCVIDFD